MTIEESREQRRPTHLEALGTTGAQPFPPTAETLKDYGPLADTPDAAVAGVTVGALSSARADMEVVVEGQSLSPLAASLRRLGRDRRAMVSLAIVLFVVVGSFVFPYFYTHYGPAVPDIITNQPVGPDQYHSYTYQELGLIDGFPSALHPLGLDQLGRDILARLMAGVNVSIEVALLVEGFDVGLGLLVGVLAGFYGKWIDTALARFTDIMFAFPGLLFAILMAATLGSTFQKQFGTPGRLILVSLALGIAIWPQMARFVRGQTLQLKEQQFVEAARTVGGTDRTIILRHIVPNLFSIVVTAFTLNIVGTIIGEATISLLGLGIQPPGSSLGRMIQEGIPKIHVNPLEVLIPAMTVTLLVLCFSFVGDGVRDAFDPRTKD